MDVPDAVVVVPIMEETGPAFTAIVTTSVHDTPVLFVGLASGELKKVRHIT